MRTPTYHGLRKPRRPRISRPFVGWSILAVAVLFGGPWFDSLSSQMQAVISVLILATMYTGIVWLLLGTVKPSDLDQAKHPSYLGPGKWVW